MEPDADLCMKSLTAMRRYMAKHTDGRIFIGGKREGFRGNLPGLVEEFLFALDADLPIILQVDLVVLQQT